MKKITPFLFTSLLLAATSCGSYVNEPMPPVDVEFLVEGPIFAGPNEASATIIFNPEENGIDRDRIKAISISAIELTTDAENGFDNFQSISVLLMAEGIDMKNIAVLNPIEKGQKTLSLKVSNEVDFEKVAQLKEFHLVMDANLSVEDEYMDEDISVKGKVTYTIKAKEKK